MKLKEVTVRNYRSIGTQTKFTVDNLTTLVGPNNEGKSNLLRALALGMEVIQRWSTTGPEHVENGEIAGAAASHFISPRRSSSTRGSQIVNGYRWSDDYPLSKQNKTRSRDTLIQLRFRLSEEEVKEFADQTGISSNGELPIEITLGPQSVKFGIPKQGPGAATHRAKSREIADFVDSRISLVSVPAIRTSGQAVSLVNELTRIRTKSILNSDEYKSLTIKLNQLRQEAIDEVGKDLLGSVRRYIPSVNSIELQNADIERTNTIEDLAINDGTVTSIGNKGDGIKSLVTMALIQELAQEKSTGHSLILAVDEPEAHLHPASVHELQNLFQSVSATQQVILATHNPIFVNRERVSSNILVRSNTARPANQVGSIREALGVELRDNLQSAETVVLVEGITDERALPAMLGGIDATVEREIADGRVVFRATRGTGKIKANIQTEKSTICKILVVFDDDDAGRKAAREIHDAQLLPDKDVFLLGGRKTYSEIEDLVRPEAYLQVLDDEFGRKFEKRHFANKANKWSKNLSLAFIELGIAGEEGMLIDRAKVAVSRVVADSGASVIREDRMDHLKALTNFILQKSNSQ